MRTARWWAATTPGSARAARPPSTSARRRWPRVQTRTTPRAACNLAYDLRLLCSTDGRRCAAPPVEWVGQRIERYLGTGDVYECPDCGMHSAFEWRVAEELGIPMVGPRAALDEVMCGHCRTTFGDDGRPIREVQLPVETLRAA